jgi:hypothetical protein
MAKAWTAKEDAELIRLANSGVLRIEIASRLDRTLTSLEARARKLSIAMATPSKSHRNRLTELRRRLRAKTPTAMDT